MNKIVNNNYNNQQKNMTKFNQINMWAAFSKSSL